MLAFRRLRNTAVEMKGGVVEWQTYVCYFFGGVFLVNSVPHFTNGVSGRRLPTPFASLLGKRDSSPTVNVLWGALNLVIGCVLVGRVGEFHLHRTSQVLALGAGGLLMAVVLAQLFECIYGGQQGGDLDGAGRRGAGRGKGEQIPSQIGTRTRAEP
jgi:hypothetical protein